MRIPPDCGCITRLLSGRAAVDVAEESGEAGRVVWLQLGRGKGKKVGCLALMISTPDRNGEVREVALKIGTALLIKS